MSYIVLARKWRSKYFEEVVGQEHVTKTLCNAIEQDRVAHAFLFCGPRGVGKTSTARILAKALNCHEGPTTTPCYKCPSCTEINAGNSVDVFEIDGASNRGVNEIRELREGVRYAASRDRHKIYIIDEVHMLTTEAFNALLKTLEEPPAHVKFIFATTEPQKIPVTILSRCQRFDFKRIPMRKITGWLEHICRQENIEAEPSALSLIARQADGGMRDALSLTDQVISFSEGVITENKVAEILGVASRETLFKLSASLFEHRVEEALTILDEVNRSGHDLMHFASALVSHFRDLTVVQVTKGKTEITDLTEQEMETAIAQVKEIETSVLHRMFNLMVQAAENMSRSSYPKLMFEMSLVKLAAIEPLTPLPILLKRLETLESGLLLGLGKPEAGQTPAALPAPSATQPKTPEPAGGSVIQFPNKPKTTPTPPKKVRPPKLPDFDAIPTPEPPKPKAEKTEKKRPSPKPELRSDPRPSAPIPDDPRETHTGRTEIQPARPRSPSDKGKKGSSYNPVQASEALDHYEGAIQSDKARPLWEKLVAGISNPSFSGVFKQAYLLALTPGTIHLGYPDHMIGLVDAEKHIPLIVEQADKQLKSLHEGPWKVEVARSDGPAHPGQRSLSAEFDERHRAKLASAKAAIESHPVIQEAMSIFKTDQIRVVLEDNGHYT